MSGHRQKVPPQTGRFVLTHVLLGQLHALINRGRGRSAQRIKLHMIPGSAFAKLNQRSPVLLTPVGMAFTHFIYI